MPNLGQDWQFFIRVTLKFDGWPSTRQIWGIWKMRPAYSLETTNLCQNQWCFVPCDLEMWCMTLKNNSALKVKDDDPPFQYQPRVSQNACLVQISRFYVKSVTSYRSERAKFMDRQTDRLRQYPFGLKGQGPITKWKHEILNTDA